MGKLCGGNGVAIMAIISIASLPHLHKRCAPNNASQCERTLPHAQMCPDIFVIVHKDEEGKLEALPSTSLLFWVLGVKVGKINALAFCIVSSPRGKLDILPFLFLHH
eukprot:5937589-Ditylum_brightwellii.AAC.1